ncbi:MAG: hypothetical protein A2Z25_05600 [Planctomycetes bacterium RBG_16_55_9]|nr:MAG: hypothetical protein A2Z25_05600 [Planctomycetes bacterium RBG_16_55_9]
MLTIIGYTPYGDKITEVQELLDPHGVDAKRDKWGFVTRLAHLDDLVEDGNSPFKLYKKAEKEQFSLNIKEVDLKNSDSTPPEGIGVWEERIPKGTTAAAPSSSRLGYVGTQSEWALVDPMTKETINKVPVLSEDGKQVLHQGLPVFQVNDHWFELNLKFEWTEAPEPPKQTVTSPYGSRLTPTTPGTSTPTTTPSPSSGSSGRRSAPDLDM